MEGLGILATMPILDLMEPAVVPPGPVLKTRPFSSVKEIKRAFARRFGITVADLEGECRQRKIATPRQMAMALAYRRLRKLGYSTSMIGRCFNRDHTTVLYACRKYGHVPERNPRVRAATIIDLAKWREIAELGDAA